MEGAQASAAPVTAAAAEGGFMSYLPMGFTIGAIGLGTAPPTLGQDIFNLNA